LKPKIGLVTVSLPREKPELAKDFHERAIKVLAEYAQVIAVSDTSMVLTLASEEKRVNGLVKMFKPLGIIEMSRSGKLAVRGLD